MINLFLANIILLTVLIYNCGNYIAIYCAFFLVFFQLMFWHIDLSRTAV